MSIQQVLITAAFAVVIPVAALAQSSTEPAQPKHDCGMMAARPQALPPAPAGDAAPMADTAPMACCLSRAAAVDHAAHANIRPMAGGGSGDMEGTAAGCCGAQMAAGEKMAPREKVATRERMTARKGKEECCCAKTPTP